jgi:hypothetical protein
MQNWGMFAERRLTDTEISETLGAQAETVNLDEDDDEGFEPNVEQAVDQRDV